MYIFRRGIIFGANSALPLVCYYFGCAFSWLLIYVDRLFDFMLVSKYGSGTGRAVDPTLLGPIWIYVRLEYFSSVVDARRNRYIYIVWYFKRSLLVSRPHGSGWAKRLARFACWSKAVERRTVRYRRTYNNERVERVWMSSALTKVWPLQPAGQVSIRWETGETYSHIERTWQWERGRRLTRVHETDRGIHRRSLVPSCLRGAYAEGP